MRNILKIMTRDLRNVTGSVVAIITMMGLCIVPCLYAWFNIFSNWAPYDSDATSRILVAVANEDAGAEMMGLSLNVGDTVVSGLAANDAIGWVFVDSSEEAVDGVYASDYYAALVIPSDFSEDVVSFITGDPENPQMIYYENEKKNAIAPKITGKAKTAVQEEVNATFIETLVKYVSELAAVADASGNSPQTLLSELSDQTGMLSERLETCVVILDSISGLSSAAQNLIDVSDQLIGDAQDTLGAGEGLLKVSSDNLPETQTNVKETADAVRKVCVQLDKNLDMVYRDLVKTEDKLEAFNDFVSGDLPSRIELINAMRDSSESMATYLNSLGLTVYADRFSQIAGNLSDIAADLGKLEEVQEEAWEDTQDIIVNLMKAIKETDELVQFLGQDVTDDIEKELLSAIRNARNAANDMQKSLNNMSGELGSLSIVLNRFSDSLGKLENGLDDTKKSLEFTMKATEIISDLLSRLADNDTLEDIDEVLADTRDVLAAYIASPVQMATEVVYPIETYGSAMAPFYTVLAQWVGALLTAVLVKVKLRNKEGLVNLRLHQHFFGRYGLYMFIGIAQALIVSLGDLLYVGIQCLHPFRFVLAALVNGIVFMIINYALVFALDNIGLAVGVIILVLQVGGSGGTYPVEVVPDIFKVLYPFMPFRYSMDAMRECIGGMYDGTYAKCLATLGLFVIGSIVLGLALYYPALWLNRLIAESKAKSEIMLE